MTTLNRMNTDLFLCSVYQENESGANNSDFFGWLFNFSGITDTNYNSLVTAWNSWKSAYDGGTLYGTKPDTTTFQIQGISHFPIPPSR